MGNRSVFYEKVENKVLFDLLEQICLKTEKFYVVNENAYKKMKFMKLHVPFLNAIVACYHISKQFYVTRKLTYNSFTNIVRQICKHNEIVYTTFTKYSESDYDIEYHVYF